MNIATTMQAGQQQLNVSSDSPHVDAERLLMHVLQVTRAYLHTWPERALTPAQVQHYQQLIAQRRQGTPVAYLLECQPFWSLDLKVSPATLIPRPETELLVEMALNMLKATSCHIADLGTGSGAIALALAHERPQWHITATDICPHALAIAQDNAQRLDLNHVQFLKGHWCHALKHRDYTALISNPPYIAPEDPHLQRGDLRFEPRHALSADQEGLADLNTIIQQAPRYLKPNGWIFLEHGYNQADATQALLKKQKFARISTHLDLSGQPRITSARLD